MTTKTYEDTIQEYEERIEEYENRLGEMRDLLEDATRTSQTLDGLLDDLRTIAEGIGEGIMSPADRKWRITMAVLHEVDRQGGSVTASELSSIGKDLGYDPRGLGGFFKGKKATLKVDPRDANRRVLTGEGQRLVDEWKTKYPSLFD